MKLLFRPKHGAKPWALAAIGLGLVAGIALSGPVGSASAQTPPSAAATPQAEPSRRTRTRSATPRPATPAQLAARDRMRRCGAEWREIRAANRQGSRTWNEFRRECLQRLRGRDRT